MLASRASEKVSDAGSKAKMHFAENPARSTTRQRSAHAEIYAQESKKEW